MFGSNATFRLAGDVRIPVYSMPAESRAESPEHRPAVITAADPLAAYREYYKAIRSRNLDAVLAVVAEETRVNLLELFTNSDSGPLFDLWCESQQVATVVTGCSIRGDKAIVRTRSWDSEGRIMLRRHAAKWYIYTEKYWPITRARTDCAKSDGS